MAHLKIFNLLQHQNLIYRSLGGMFFQSFVPEYFCLWPKANLLFQESDTFQREENQPAGDRRHEETVHGS